MNTPAMVRPATLKCLKKAIITASKQGASWRKIGTEYGITGGMAYRIAHGYEPREAHIRHTLHLPALVEVAPCAKCGGNHGMKRCPNPAVTPRNRRAINLADPVSAATTILTHAPDAAYVARLVELLTEIR